MGGAAGKDWPASLKPLNRGRENCYGCQHTAGRGGGWDNKVTLTRTQYRVISLCNEVRQGTQTLGRALKIERKKFGSLSLFMQEGVA